MAAKILVIEPDAQLREAVCLHLSLEGYQCAGYAGLERVGRDTVNDGFSVAVINIKSRRAGPPMELGDVAGRAVPKLAVAVLGGRGDALRALEEWADDYVTTPFEMRELIARVHALIRRKRMLDENPEIAATGAGARIAHEGLDLDAPRRRVEMDGRGLKLTEKEFRLLQLIAAQPGIVFPRQLLLATFGPASRVPSRNIDKLVMGIRRQLRIGSHGWDIATVRGIGYQFRRHVE